MPNTSFGGKSVRDVVSSQNADHGSTTPARRSRSGSTGRSSALGSHIVQDVYDRMGVNYIRGRPSIENLLEDDKANNEAITPTPRGRSAIRRSESYDAKSSTPSRGRKENSNDSDRRRRLPSRGRISTIWPPPDAAGSTGNHKPSSSASQPSAVDAEILLTSGTSVLKERNSYARRSMPQPSRPDLRQSYTESRDEMKEDEPSPQDDDRDCVSVKSVKSVKDRINAFGASSRPSTAARNVRRSFNSKFTKPQHPKKVDIYANSTASTDDQGGKQDVAEAFVDASDNMGLNTYVIGREPRFSAANSSSHHRSANSRNAPDVEIPSNQIHVGDEDLASIAASSVSGVDFAESPKKRNRTDDKFSWNDGPPDAHIEKLVEERVQAHIATLTEKFEGEIRQIEHRMEQDYKARIDELENKTDKVNSILSKILVNKEVSGRFEI
jgi:hypothetical protein